MRGMGFCVSCFSNHPQTHLSQPVASPSSPNTSQSHHPHKVMKKVSEGAGTADHTKEFVPGVPGKLPKHNPQPTQQPNHVPTRGKPMTMPAPGKGVTFAPEIVEV